MCEGLSPKAKAKKVCWGVEILSVERGGGKPGLGLPFSLVVTLREIKGNDRLEQFIRNCNIHHEWEVMARTYQEAKTELTFED